MIDRESKEILRLMRERSLLRDAILDIDEELDDPSHGATDSDLHNNIRSIILELKNQWEKR